MIYPTDQEAVAQIIQVGRLLYEKGLNVGTDGNFSCRVEGGNYLWTTGSGSAKGFLTENDLVKCDLQGNVVEGAAKPSSELKVHLCVYAHNARAQAVIHAHTVAATALASAGVGLTEPLLPPVTLQLGRVHVAPYALTGTQAVADSILPYVAENNAVLLANHGAVTWGKDLWQAFTRMETLEQCAKITLQVRALGTPQYLTPAQEQELHEYGVRLGNFEADKMLQKQEGKEVDASILQVDAIGNQPSEIIKAKLKEQGGHVTVYTKRGLPCEIYAGSDGRTFTSDKLPIDPPYEYDVFNTIIDLLMKQGGRARKGNGRNYKLGEPGCEENTVVGVIAKKRGYHAGESVYDPVFVMAAILEWAGLVENGRGELILMPEYREMLSFVFS